MKVDDTNNELDRLFNNILKKKSIAIKNNRGISPRLQYTVFILDQFSFLFQLGFYQQF